MLVVHHLETSRSQRVLWLLEELGVPYELKIYRRNPVTRLAPPELRQVHPLGKSPVITDDGRVVAESGVILEYLADKYGRAAQGELAALVPEPGTPEFWQCRYWMHYAEGSLMNWLVMKLVFNSIPAQPMPFFARPIARKLCSRVQQQLIEPNLATAAAFIDDHLSRTPWFLGPALSIADFQMSFAVEALLARGANAAGHRHLTEYRTRMRARPAYGRAEVKGGPVLMSG
jgi:glutathione S-transferase